ncbi:hypothetical protein ABPG72_015784 [Tetrahymena utriculariae]
MSQDLFKQKLRPLSHNVYSHNSETRSSTANPQKNKQGTIYKGNFLSKALSPLNQEAMLFQQIFQQRARPITTGGLQYPQTTTSTSNQFIVKNQLKPRTAATYNVTQKVSQHTQIGRPITTASAKHQERNLLDFNLIESEVYPGIYYAKTSLRNLLKEIKFPKQIKALPPDDYRLNLIYQIIQKLFHELNFFLFNILICQHEITQNYLIFFSDSESVPFSKCCNSPVYVELYESGTGRIMCNDQMCQMQLLTEFIINFEEGQNLWKENLVFNTNPNQDSDVRRQVSKLITTGFFKHKSIVKEVKKLQKSTQYKQKNTKEFYPLLANSQENFQQTQNQYFQNPFLTAQEEGNQAYYGQKQPGFNQFNAPQEFQDLQFQSSDSFQEAQQSKHKFNLKSNIPIQNLDNNEQQLPLTRLKINQGELIVMNQKIANGLVQNSQIFNKEFKSNNKFEVNPTQNKWRPQSFSNAEGEFQLRMPNNAPSIRLKSGFNKEKRNKSTNHKQFLEQIDKHHQSKQNDEDKTLLDIKNMINDILS